MLLYEDTPSDTPSDSVWAAEGYWGNQVAGAIPDPVDSPEQDAFNAAFTGYFYQQAYDVGGGSPGNSLGGLGLAVWAGTNVGESSGSSGGTVTVGPVETVYVETNQE
ncbi:hypothetical protein IAI18_02070 [Acetobacteraceae bacterium H6797]|nr:hypothetical protein [Acetobacteraceae bacterium H6797]